LLDAMVDWEGQTSSTTQALRWPRYATVDRDGWPIDGDVIPSEVEEATVELALALLSSNRFIPPGLLGQGFEEVAVGSIRVKVSQQQVENVIPGNVFALISHLGSLNPTATHGTKTLRLERM
jgi:hypothetical protein